MPKWLTFLHTSPVHVATFETILQDVAPGIPTKHIVDEALLEKARGEGNLQQLADDIKHRLTERDVHKSGVVLCTCSTIGPIFERLGDEVGAVLIRIDRPMAQAAVVLADHILVVATLASTLRPTTALLKDAAATVGKTVRISKLFCSEAWEKFERGDIPAYHRQIAACLQRESLTYGVIVFAQASMAGARALCEGISIPILSSPQLGVTAAVSAYRAQR
jgi:hypothetical protein